MPAVTRCAAQRLEICRRQKPTQLLLPGKREQTVERFIEGGLRNVRGCGRGVAAGHGDSPEPLRRFRQRVERMARRDGDPVEIGAPSSATFRMRSRRHRTASECLPPGRGWRGPPERLPVEQSSRTAKRWFCNDESSFLDAAAAHGCMPKPAIRTVCGFQIDNV